MTTLSTEILGMVREFWIRELSRRDKGLGYHRYAGERSGAVSVKSLHVILAVKATELGAGCW